MSFAIIYPGHNARRWQKALLAIDPALKIEIWPEIKEKDAVQFVLCWNQPPGSLRQFPNLKAISSLGAGVNHLLDDVTRPAEIPLLRLVDTGLQQSMAEYVLLGALEHFRQFSTYRQQQLKKEWRPHQSARVSEIGVGIMGLGAIGTFVGRRLLEFGFTVHGWSRTPKQLDGIACFSGMDALDQFLGLADILICLLPLTGETENLLNARTLAKLPNGAYLINVARGGHLVDEDLLSALDSGHLAGALLDVFREEPLPAGHPFWGHEKIMLTPHIASVTNPYSAASQVIANYHRARAGEPLLNQVDPERGY